MTHSPQLPMLAPTCSLRSPSQVLGSFENNTSFMRTLIIIALILVHLVAFSQDRKTGIINDPDGYTNIRDGKGVSFEIVGKIYTNELFTYWDSADKNWLKVGTTRGVIEDGQRKYKNVEGFIHRSRISNIEELATQEKRQLYSYIFETERSNYTKLIESKDKTSLEYKQIALASTIFHDYQFDYSFRSFKEFICSSKDRKLFEQFLGILELEAGSADEAPLFALGSIFKCQPEWVFESMKIHLGLMSKLEWGIVGDKTYEDRYNELRASIGLSKTNFKLYYEDY